MHYGHGYLTHMLSTMQVSSDEECIFENYMDISSDKEVLLSSDLDDVESNGDSSMNDDSDSNDVSTFPNDADCKSSGKSLADELLLFFIVFNLPIHAQQYLLKLLCRYGVQVPCSVYKLRNLT